MSDKYRTFNIRGQSLAISVMQDLFSVSAMCFAFWFNYTYIEGNNFLDLIIFISIFTYAFKYASHLVERKEFQNKKELLEYLTDEK